MKKIAIIGSGCLLPEYLTKKEFWDLLIYGKSCFQKEKFDEKIIERGHIRKKDSDMFFRDKLSSEEFEVLREKGETYKWMAYVIKSALEESGYLDNKAVLKKAGLISGSLGCAYAEDEVLFSSILKTEIENELNFLIDGSGVDFQNNSISQRISKEVYCLDTDLAQTCRRLYGIGKETLSMSAACATPLYAIKIACMYLETFQADLMIAAANSSNESDAGISALFNQLGILALENKCNPFSNGSEGIIISSGAGAVVLKRLEDAERDGDHIYGVIEAIGWSNDGADKGLLAPSSEGQLDCFRKAYSDGVSNEIDYIECHATGTSVGDAEEYETIRSYFGKYGKTPLIGALKGNTGHFLTASAMGSLIKVLLSMEKGIIPKTARVDKAIGDEVVTENTVWPQTGREKRAAVNAFGFGGINAHLVVSEYKPETNFSTNVNESVDREEDIAVVGMALKVGEINNKEQLFLNLLEEQPIVREYEETEFDQRSRKKNFLKLIGEEQFPKGAYIYRFPFDFFRFRIPVKNNVFYLRRDLLLLKVVEEALAECGITTGATEKVAVIINAGKDTDSLMDCYSIEYQKSIKESLIEKFPTCSEKTCDEVLSILREDELLYSAPESIVGVIPSIRGSRISHFWNLKGPSFMLLERERAFSKSLELAELLLVSNQAETVVIGTVELYRSLYSLYGEILNGNRDEIYKNGLCEGAAVLVLEKKTVAISRNRTVFGTVQCRSNKETEQNTTLIKSRIGYSSSLQGYTGEILHQMGNYYNVNLSDDISQSERKDVIRRVVLKQEMAFSRMQKNDGRSFIKMVQTALPDISEREIYQRNARKYSFRQTTDEYVPEVWNREQLCCMAAGKMSAVLGKEYEDIDQYEIRARMPLPPYMFVSRVTRVQAKKGELKPSWIEIEYDITEDCIYLTGDNSVSASVYYEASQIGILLGAYIGIDLSELGALRFRAVESRGCFVENVDVCLGDTIRLVFCIDKYIKRGSSVIINAHYDVFKGDRRFLAMNLNGGYFEAKELLNNRGIIIPRIKLPIDFSDVPEMIGTDRAKKSYSQENVTDFYNGDYRNCFYDEHLANYRGWYVNQLVRMIDEVIETRSHGGRYGLGYITGRKGIDPSHWAFKAHFKNDPVFPGTLLMSGIEQLLRFWLIYTGIYCGDPERKPEKVLDTIGTVEFRGQIIPEKGDIQFFIDIKKITRKEERVYVIAEALIRWKEIYVLRESNISVCVIQSENEKTEMIKQ